MTRPKEVAKAVLCGFYKYTAAALLQERVARLNGRAFMAVLLFHRVTDAIPEDGLTVSTKHFRRICDLLRRHFHAVPLAEIFMRLRDKLPFPPRTVAITFDDCYGDNLAAARTLADYGLPATFFVPTGFLGTDHVFAWDRQLPAMPNLTWDQLHDIVRLGHEVGSHGVHHADFGRISAAEAAAELSESKAVLEQRLDRSVRWFAYPFGGPEHLLPALLPLIEEAGYEGSLSGYGGFVRPGSDPRVIPRVPAPPFYTLLNLELHLRGCLDWFYALKRHAGWMPDARHDALYAAQNPDEPLAVAGKKP